MSRRLSQKEREDDSVKSTGFFKDVDYSRDLCKKRVQHTREAPDTSSGHSEFFVRWVDTSMKDMGLGLALFFSVQEFLIIISFVFFVGSFVWSRLVLKNTGLPVDDGGFRHG
jgi:hypothetical protein